MNAKPTVLMLSQEVHPIPPLKGAAVEQWIDAVALSLQHHQALVVSPPHPTRFSTEMVGNVTYERIGLSDLYKRLFRKMTRLDPWPYIQRVIGKARRFAPEIIHIHNAPNFAKPLRKAFPHASLILHMHNEKKLPSDLQVDCLVGCSDYICRWFENNVAWQSKPRFERVRNGVDVSHFQPRWQLGENRITSIKAQHGIPSDRINILYVGRISPEKGPDLLVDAFRFLDQACFHLTLVGEWPEGDAAKNSRVRFADELKQKLCGLSVTVLGCIPPDQVANIYPVGNLMVIPSRFEEPFSMVAIEAMASGVPVMALRRGGMVEYMRDGENAHLLPAQTQPEELAAAIEVAVQDKAKLIRIAQAARTMVETTYSWQQVVTETENLYQNLLNTRKV